LYYKAISTDSYFSNLFSNLATNIGDASGPSLDQRWGRQGAQSSRGTVEKFRTAWSRQRNVANRIPVRSLKRGEPGALATSEESPPEARCREFKSRRPHHNNAMGHDFPGLRPPGGPLEHIGIFGPTISAVTAPPSSRNQLTIPNPSSV